MTGPTTPILDKVKKRGIALGLAGYLLLLAIILLTTALGDRFLWIPNPAQNLIACHLFPVVCLGLTMAAFAMVHGMSRNGCKSGTQLLPLCTVLNLILLLAWGCWAPIYCTYGGVLEWVTWLLLLTATLVLWLGTKGTLDVELVNKGLRRASDSEFLSSNPTTVPNMATLANAPLPFV